MRTVLLLFACVAVFFAVSGSAAVAGMGDMDQTRLQTQDCDDCCVSADCVCDCCVDADGDGVCDDCGEDCVPIGPDDDGDGIPNGQDGDYTPPEDGTGAQNREGK